ncbi:MAG: hypothetical protein HYW34_01015 [Candidatus Brennerbacteria bacterium]|nr:hypothetical protein [Candidatus Brennerbacteria bacterium]
MLNFLKKQPIEFYILILLPLIALACFMIFDRIFLEMLDRNLGKSAKYYLFFSGPLLPAGFIFVYEYLFIKAALIVKNYIKTSKTAVSAFKFSWLEFYKNFKSLIFLSVAIGFSALINNLLIGRITLLIPAEKIKQTSQLLMSWDYALFKTYPPFWLQNFFKPFMGAVLLNSYLTLSALMGIIFLLLLVFKKTFLRKYILSLVLASTAGLPFWYFAPAIAPQPMYQNNIFKIEMPLNIQNSIDSAQKNMDSDLQKKNRGDRKALGR